ncbi:endonuclease MutS2 [Candidatus Nitrospira bockiana]
MSRADLLQQAAVVVEWPRLLDALAGYARSTLGMEYCRTLVPEADFDAAVLRLRETEDMVALQAGEDPFPSPACPDIRGVLSRAAKGAVLEAHELRDVGLALAVGLEVVRYIARHRAEAPAVADLAAPLSDLAALQRLKEHLERCIDEEGQIKESATPELRRLSQHAGDLKQHMRRRLETILASSRYADVLQEQYFAQREGRYVVPVKADMRAKIPGIVHDVSSSGATVFLEPRELVELNNAIKVAELEVDREVRRILQDLSGDVARDSVALSTAVEVLGRLDCLAAKAALSGRIGGRPVTLSAEGRIALTAARHPLLVLAKDEVVPNDLVLDAPVRVLIISGPNTGGKTVTLKVLGLFALMVRAGLQPPCGPDSEMGFFPEVYADIGDAQDLTKNLSSFSAHMTQMIDLLKEAESRPAGAPPALVLLDEPATSTDPAEGAALAEALLRRLARLGLKVVVTTHYNALKALGQTTPAFMNASVGFDVSTLSPTYRVIMGVPGGSSAIEIAGRLGMDESILEDALRLVRREDRSLERMLSDLQEKQRRLEADAAEIAALKSRTERATRESEAVAARLSATEREERKRLKKQWAEELARARTEIHAALEALKKEQTRTHAKQAAQRVSELHADVSRRLAEGDHGVPLERLRPGDSVELIGLGARAVLLEAPGGKKRVRVQMGGREMSVEVSSLLGTDDSALPEAPRAPAPPFRPRSPAATHGEGVAVLDLRGKTADEALDLTVAALDRAALAGTPFLRLIHGHGTGRLKASLRAYLRDSPYVAGFRAGERAEGGDGVTIVELK